MKRFTAVICALAGAVALANVSYADAPKPRDPGVNSRQHNQRGRIAQGVKSGELTRRETGKLIGEQRDIRQLERAYTSDGKLTVSERKDLQHELNQQNRTIYKQKHDEQERGN